MLVVSLAFASLFNVGHFGSLYVGEDNGYTLLVSNAASRQPVAGASVRLYKGDKLLGERVTNATGYASFLLHPLETGLIAFSITKEGFNEYVLFQKAVMRPTPTPEATPAPAPSPQNATAPTTGYLLVNPSEGGLFLFAFAVAFICLFGASAIFYKNFMAEGASSGAWDMANAFKAVTAYFKKK